MHITNLGVDESNVIGVEGEKLMSCWSPVSFKPCTILKYFMQARDVCSTTDLPTPRAQRN